MANSSPAVGPRRIYNIMRNTLGLRKKNVVEQQMVLRGGTSGLTTPVYRVPDRSTRGARQNRRSKILENVTRESGKMAQVFLNMLYKGL